ncbi:MAG: DegT/DnrJ/EryC1/StrS family aminotransferase [Planctomycetes bacterium]|nr:DegT/DnrJ/EryC1/StrS family aminotransferase [Planctomycetota bacterium]
MKRERIHSAGPSITEAEVAAVTDAARNGWYSNFRDCLTAFEKEFCEYTGAKYAIATSSCTTALHLGAAALGLGEGDEVIVPDMTWIATVSALMYEGVKPVFVDIDPDSWTIDPDKIRAAITPRTKAIVPVDMYGHPSDYDAIRKICDEFGLILYADSAPAVGSLYKGKSTAMYADAACYSFQGAKMMATGEGGIFVTNNEELFKRAEFLVDDGRDESERTFWIKEIGFHYRMANLLAALGRAQLARIEELVEIKRNQYRMYHERLGSIPGIKMFLEKDGCRVNSAYPSMVLEGEFATDRDGLRKELRARKIDTRPTFPHVSAYPMFETVDSKVAKHIATNGINLPTPAYIDEEDADLICDNIKDILGV